MVPCNASKRGAMSSRFSWSKCKKCCRIFAARLFSHIGLVALVIGYSILGALTFEALEAEHEISRRRFIQHERQNCLDEIWRLTKRLNVLHEVNWTIEVSDKLRKFEYQVINAVKSEGYDGKDENNNEKQWSFSGALLYSVTVITTIGYGNLSPKTDKGKVVTILYAIIGIPLMLLCLTNIGDFFAHAFKFAYSRVCCVLCTRQERRVVRSSSQYSTRQSSTNQTDVGEAAVQIQTVENMDDAVSLQVDSTTRVPIWLVLFIVASYVGIGAIIFSVWEKWSPLNGAYFCFITLSTIGFGDLVPGTYNFDTETGAGQAKLIICCFYLVLGLSIIAMAFNLVQEEVIVKCKRIAVNMGMIKDERVTK